MSIKSIWKFIFHHKEYVAEKKEIAKQKYLDSLSEDLIIRLKFCKQFSDLIKLHAEIFSLGFDFDTKDSWNFHNKCIYEVSVTDLIFYAYDRDSCIHGKELLTMEVTPDLDNDWLVYSYWSAWDWYWQILLRKITRNNSIVIKTPIPSALSKKFH